MLLFFLLLNLTVTPWVVSLLFGFNAPPRMICPGKS